MQVVAEYFTDAESTFVAFSMVAGAIIDTTGGNVFLLLGRELECPAYTKIESQIQAFVWIFFKICFVCESTITNQRTSPQSIGVLTPPRE